ncbi:hypothetical protein OHV05_38135 (plasmid) [Kitasatospora sp. NBC_00070]|uniref:DUF4434 domain-containing protein n=1 Tax=Kitasatospora sp. NBC_00070 TaxID=2975962 RepID=UPI002F90B5A8
MPSLLAGEAGAQQTAPRAKFGATFYLPHTSGSDSWGAGRWNLELAQIAAAGIGTVTVQYTVDDRGVASYPAAGIPNGPDVTTPLLDATSANGVKVWLGLAGPLYWDFYQNADNPAYMAGLLTRQKIVAAELASRYPGKIAGRYILQEVDDALLTNAAKTAGARTYYTSLVAYLQSTTGLRVLASQSAAGSTRGSSRSASARCSTRHGSTCWRRRTVAATGTAQTRSAGTSARCGTSSGRQCGRTPTCTRSAPVAGPCNPPNCRAT